jgi:hypothetical protein
MGGIVCGAGESRRVTAARTLQAICLELRRRGRPQNGGPAISRTTPSQIPQTQPELLRNEGYTGWGKIELEDDDDIWKIDDAYASDGRKYNLQLEPDALEIVARAPDDD